MHGYIITNEKMFEFQVDTFQSRELIKKLMHVALIQHLHMANVQVF